MGILEIISTVAIVMFSVIIHEIAHGWVALRCGDSTARDAGRLTLNPLPHIDPFMTLLLPGLLAVQYYLLGGSGIIFGGAKPVPVNLYRLRGGQRDHVKVSLAGAVANILLALVAALLGALFLFIYRATEALPAQAMVGLLLKLMLINLFLANFNLLPIPPLDGSWVLAYFLRGEARRSYARLQAMGFQVFLIFMVVGWFTGLLNLLFRPALIAANLLTRLMLLVAG